MSKFYTNVHIKGSKVYLRGFQDGKRIDQIVPYKPYLFVPSEGGFYRTIDGKSCDKMVFSSIYDARDYIKRYSEVDNFPIYGLTNFPYLFIYDNYPGEIDYDQSLPKIASIDIECAADEGFPSISKADKEVTAITIRSKGQSLVFGCGDFVSPDKTITYLKFENEIDLLNKFVVMWHKMSPDIVTGWNIDFFDIPYLYNRIRNVIDQKTANLLSPWGLIEEREVFTYGKAQQMITLVGISSLDYYQLYKKFTFGNQESYKLDYIASVELGTKKVDYSEYGSLLGLYKNNFQKFIEYNIQDVVLVDKLEEKLKFIEQVLAIAYDAKINYTDTFTTVRPWDIIVHNYLLDRRIVIPQQPKNVVTRAFAGGYVKEPRVDLAKWVVSFDLTSLYPHIIMGLNISPETFIRREETFPTIDSLLTRKAEFITTDDSYAANGSVYSKQKQGFLPALMEKMFNDRVVFKNKMLDAKKQYQVTPTPQLSNEIAKYHNFQMAKKIQLNSAYGALSNTYFRWFDLNHAEAITATGQLAIQWVAKYINAFMNHTLKTKNVDYIIYSDTDSVYVELDAMVHEKEGSDKKQLTRLVDKFCEEKIQPVIGKAYDDLKVYMNTFDQKFFMKRETIADKGIFIAKKRYILNAYNIEGVEFEEPVLKITGIASVRSSTPKACRESIDKALKIIFNEDEKSLQDFILKSKEEFLTLPFEQVASPRGVNGLSNYADSASIYKKGSPIQVKGSLLYNKLIKDHKLINLAPIQDGDKIRFAYLKMPNPIHDTVIAVPDTLPEEFGLDRYIDRELQFDKAFVEPLRDITKVIGWEVEKRATLDRFFS